LDDLSKSSSASTPRGRRCDLPLPGRDTSRKSQHVA
jgi:hypothetical protein